MGFKCGIVGLPNVGKSTLFNALTQAGIEAANYPFCTIEPNVGVVAVPDPRLDKIAIIVKPQRTVPTSMEFVDIAGLVAGASKGEGLGNQFLSNIRETDAIAHVVRCFIDDNVTHVATTVDPIRDIEVINIELQLADLETVEKRILRLEKQAKGGDKESKAELACLIPAQKHLADGHSLRSGAFCEELRSFAFGKQLLTAKPMMYIANVAEDYTTNKTSASAALLQQVKDYAAAENSIVVEICAHIEAEIAQLHGEDKQEFLNDMGLEEPGLNRVIRAGYQLLGLYTYFTAGVKEVRAWTFTAGSTAPQTAAVIHTDFEKGFIRAEVISYEDFIACNGEQGAKEAGKWRLEGKDYLPKDGDVMHFRFNV